MKFTFQVKKMQISQKESRIFRIRCQQNENLYKINQTEYYQEVKKIDKRQENMKLHWFCQLQSQIHQRIFKNREIIHRTHKKQRRMIMKKNQRKNLSTVKKNMSQRINTEDVRFNEIKTNRIRRIKSSYKNLLQSISREKLTFYNIFLEKAFVSRTKLQCSR